MGVRCYTALLYAGMKANVDEAYVNLCGRLSALGSVEVSGLQVVFHRIFMIGGPVCALCCTPSAFRNVT